MVESHGQSLDAAILACGEGRRVRGVASFKPLLRIGDTPIVLRLVTTLRNAGLSKITIAFHPNGKGRDELRDLENLGARYFFVETPSSMHTLFEIAKRGVIGDAAHLVISMVDTIVGNIDLTAFVKFCKALPAEESAIAITSFIEDERPLFVTTDGTSIVKFGAERTDWVTSGIYCFSRAALDTLPNCIHDNMSHMRNFLCHLVESGNILRAFQMGMTVDVDRPEDIETAETFLRGNP